MSDRTEIEVADDTLLPPESVESAPGERQKSARELMMEKIAANAEAVRQRELAQSTVYDTEARDAGLAYPHDDEVETAGEQPAHSEEAVPARIAPPPEPAPPATTAPQTFIVDVDGQQVHVTQEQMAHLARMGMVAYQALNQYNQQPRREIEPPQPREIPKLDDARVRDAVRGIQYGDPDTATGALVSFVKHVVETERNAAPPPPDVRAIVSQAATEAQQRMQLQIDTNIIRQEFADVMGNTILRNAAAYEVEDIRNRNRALGQMQPEVDIYREAGKRVREAFGTLRPGSTSPTQPAPQANGNLVVRRSADDIEAKKRAAPRVTSQVIDRRSAAPQTPRPPTPAEIVEQMRRQRGQAPMH